MKRDLLRRYIRGTLEVESSRMDEGGEQINRELQRRKGDVIDGTRKNHLMWGETSHEMNRGVDTIINLIYGKDRGRQGRKKDEKGKRKRENE